MNINYIKNLPSELHWKILSFLSEPTSNFIKDAIKSNNMALNYVRKVYRLNFSSNKFLNDLDPVVLNTITYGEGVIYRDNLPLRDILLVST